MDIDVQSEKSDISNRWETPKKTVRATSNQGNKMDIDVADKNRFDPLWDDEEDAIQCNECNQSGQGHRP